MCYFTEILHKLSSIIFLHEAAGREASPPRACRADKLTFAWTAGEMYDCEFVGWYVEAFHDLSLETVNFEAVPPGSRSPSTRGSCRCFLLRARESSVDLAFGVHSRFLPPVK